MASSNATNANANSGNALNSLPAGSFTLTGIYTCPSPGAEIYITSTGGNPGLSAGTNNPNLALDGCAWPVQRPLVLDHYCCQ